MVTKYTVARMQAKPVISVAVKGVPRRRNEQTVADKGSKVPIKVAFTGPISPTPRKNKVNEATVPMRTMKAMAIQPEKSRLSEARHGVMIRPKAMPPISMARALTGKVPHLRICALGKIVYKTEQAAEPKPKTRASGEIIKWWKSPPVAMRKTPPKASRMASMCQALGRRRR